MPTTPKPKASSVSDWKKRPDPIELPSGKFMVVRPTSLMTFIQTGQIPNTLMSTITGAIGKKKSEKDTMDEIMKKPEDLQKMFDAVDLFLTLVAIEPEVHPLPANSSDRDDDLLYVDEIDMGDKMYLFQRSIGGTTDLETFRRELAGGMDLVQQREDVEQPPKRAPRRR